MEITCAKIDIGTHVENANIVNIVTIERLLFAILLTNRITNVIDVYVWDRPRLMRWLVC